MRYQQYRNRMLKIRKILDFFHRFRFVFIGAAVVTVSTVLALDLTKGSITKTSKFEISYQYGQPISYSGESFMGDVTFEFREKGGIEWSEEVPTFVGEYETRAKSKGNHGYKYSSITTFEITPVDAKFVVDVKEGEKIHFGDDQPKVSYELLGGDKLDKYEIIYEDLTKNTTKVKVDTSSIKILNKDNIDVTSCYNLSTEDKEITFDKEKINITFKSASYTYDGEEHATDDSDYSYTGTLFYGAQIKFDQSEAVTEIGKYDHEHAISIVGEDGKDYTANYDITVNENSVTIDKRETVTIESNSLNKVYDGEPFGEDEFKYTIDGVLSIHKAEVVFTNTNNVNVVSNQDNSFTYTITDKDGNDATKYYKGINTHFGKINITKRPITIESNNLDVTYDNTEKYNDTYKITDGELVNDKQGIDVLTKTIVTNPGEFKNVQTYEIYETKVVDEVPTKVPVTDNYDITSLQGDIIITTKQLKYKFTPYEHDYDGEYHPIYEDDNVATLDDEYKDNLPEGWTCDVYLPASLRMRDYNDNGYKATDNDVKILLKDNKSNIIFDNTSGNDTHHLYQRSDFIIDFGDSVSRINKIDLNITVNDYAKNFDNQELSKSMNVNDGVLVTSSGLIAGDALEVDYKDATQKQLKNYQETPYNVGIKWTVKRDVSGQKVDVTNNYIPHYYEEKETIETTINRIPITINVDDYQKTYDGSDEIQPTLTCDAMTGLGIETAEVIKTNNKKYKVDNANVGDHTITINKEDIKIFINKVDVTNNYIIESVTAGNAHFDERHIFIDQTANSSQVVYYDGNDHGIFDGSKEVIVQTQIGNSGLLKNHSLTFTNDTHKAKEVSDNYYTNDVDEYGIKIYDAEHQEVTNNYAITMASFHVRIVKKYLKIWSNYQTSTYDGSIYNPFPNIETDTWVDADTFGGVEYQFIDNDVVIPLEEGHKVMVKIPSSIYEQTKHAGWYEYVFDFKVMNGETDVTANYDVMKTTDYLYISPANLTVTYSIKGKVYDGNTITDGPNGTFNVTKTSSASGCCFTSVDVGENFFKNFTCKATFTPYSESIYEPGTYLNAPVLSWTDTVDCIYGSDLIVTNAGSYTYSISRRDISFGSRALSGGKEIRYIASGSLATGDTLYFGDVEWERAPIVYGDGNPLSSARIMRGSVDVTHCYNISY